MIKMPPKELILRYGLLCLDFTNTVFWRLRDEPSEGFKDYSSFVLWGQDIGLITESVAGHLIQTAQIDPDETSLVLFRTIELREALYRTIVAAIKGNQPNTEDLDLINEEITKMLQRPLLIYEDNKFGWGWNVGEKGLDQLLWPILLSAAELFTSPEMERIGICKGEGCGWLFFDHSRNQSRKWCDMGDCGNRAKARRFYKRKRKNN